MYGAEDWDAVDKSTNRPGGKPKRDMVGTDGLRLSVGDASIQIVTTPGHTLGTLSYLFEIRDNGKPLRIVYSGGTAIPFNGTAAYYDQYIASSKKVAKAALAVMTDGPGGLWIGQQKVSTPQNAQRYTLPMDTDPDEAAWLVDWNGRLLKTVKTHSRNTSGMAYGNGCVWMGANAAPEGVFQVDMNSKQMSHRQIPLSCDAAIHPGWKGMESPHSGYIFSIEIV